MRIHFRNAQTVRLNVPGIQLSGTHESRDSTPGGPWMDAAISWWSWDLQQQSGPEQFDEGCLEV